MENTVNFKGVNLTIEYTYLEAVSGTYLDPPISHEAEIESVSFEGNDFYELVEDYKNEIEVLILEQYHN